MKTTITELMGLQRRAFPIVYENLIRIQIISPDPTDINGIAKELHRRSRKTQVHTYRKGTEKDIVYLDTNCHFLLGITHLGLDPESIRSRIRQKLEEVGRRLAVVAFLGEPNDWRMYLIPAVEEKGIPDEF